jgi:hypothetical protein
MDLLIFAHRAEASAFLSKDFKPFLELPFEGIYTNKKSFILITGEGCGKAREKLSSLLALTYKKIDSITNLGIAGLIGEKGNIPLHSIVGVRSCYREYNGSMEFKSFSADNKFLHKPVIDCISTSKRILSSDEKNNLSPFADLVDRELWGIGSAARLYKIPFSSYKLISDIVSDENSKEEFCQMIKGMSKLYSQKLYEFYFSHNSVDFHNWDNNKTIEESPLFQNKILYWTTSQKSRYNQLLKKIILKGLSEEELIDKCLMPLKEITCSQKEKTNLFLKEIEGLLNPFKKKMEEELNLIKADLENTSCRLQFHKHLENGRMILTAELETATHFKNLAKSLESFPVEKVQQLLSGEVNVQ